MCPHIQYQSIAILCNTIAILLQIAILLEPPLVIGVVEDMIAVVVVVEN